MDGSQITSPLEGRFDLEQPIRIGVEDDHLDSRTGPRCEGGVIIHPRVYKNKLAGCCDGGGVSRNRLGLLNKIFSEGGDDCKRVYRHGGLDAGLNCHVCVDGHAIEEHPWLKRNQAGLRPWLPGDVNLPVEFHGGVPIAGPPALGGIISTTPLMPGLSSL